tara:strand:- start:1157 stop:2224 length:1068 start_codon:yes stop_codon:yes gene_type:complete
MKNSIKSLKFIYFLAKYNSDNYPKVNIENDSYIGLDNNSIPLKILTRPNKKDTTSVIIFPGASPDAEEHTGMLFLGSIICKLGYKVLIPRIPPLKELKLNSDSFDWVAHAYSKVIQRSDVKKDRVIAMALSFGGGVLLKASLDSRVSKNPPKSIMTFGTYYDIQSTLQFLCDGKISLDSQDYHIKPHSWGLTVLFHNFLDKLRFNELDGYKQEISQIIALRIQDNLEEVENKILELPLEQAQFIRNIFECKIDKKVQNELSRVINEEKNFIELMSPKYWANTITSKVFIMHGSNDSMVPFTESISLSKYIANSSLFVSYMYEHKEISTDRGALFKIKEFYKMYQFFRKYFKYNEH